MGLIIRTSMAVSEQGPPFGAVQVLFLVSHPWPDTATGRASR